MKTALDGLSLHIFSVERQDKTHSLLHCQLMIPPALAKLGSTHEQTHLLLFEAPYSQAVIFLK